MNYLKKIPTWSLKKKITAFLFLFFILVFIWIFFPILRIGHNYTHLTSDQVHTYLYQEYPSLPINSLQSEVDIIDNKKYYTYYLPKEYLYPKFGYSINNIALVRNDLDLSMKEFIKAHELYHCRDKAVASGGWIGRELRASFFPAFSYPAGFFKAAGETLSDTDRISYYMERLREGK